MTYLTKLGIIFIILSSGCVFVPTKVVDKQYVCADGSVVQDARECRIQVQAPKQVEHISVPSNSSGGNASWICTDDMPYIASRTSKTYHLRNCSFAKRIDTAKALCFKTKQEAEAFGYSLCKTCMKHEGDSAP